MIENGYADLHGSARKIAEWTELSVFHDIEVLRKKAKIVPGRKVPKALIADLARRYEEMTPEEQTVVKDLRLHGRDGVHWQAYLKKQCHDFPEDTVSLLLLQEHFGGNKSGGYGGKGDTMSPFIWRRYGTLDRPWRMRHEW